MYFMFLLTFIKENIFCAGGKIYINSKTLGGTTDTRLKINDAIKITSWNSFMLEQLSKNLCFSVLHCHLFARHISLSLWV